MSPVLFALALDPFLNHLCCQLPAGDMARAYADDLAIVVAEVNTFSRIIPCFSLLAHASALQVNINKTVFVPLYETTLLQARAAVAHSLWAQMEIHLGCSKYLGFQVGPLADAEVNFRPAMEKFRRRSLHWLSLRHIGEYFQCFGFNMCCISTLNFISQLYVLPPSLAKECSEMALRFMHGPRFWLHGPGGHAYFRAGIEIGLKAIPKCPHAVSLAFCFKSAAQHLPDFSVKIQGLVLASCDGPFRVGQISEIVKASPAWHSKMVHGMADALQYRALCARAPIYIHVHNIAYNMFFDKIHPLGATYYRLEAIYSQRWVQSVLIGGHVPYLTFTACENLKWLSLQVPARVHLANVRLHFNGWHTDRRYQDKHTQCRFCRDEHSEDSLEHYMICTWVNSCFPPHWKTGSPPQVQSSRFFLLCLPQQEVITMSVFHFALYSVCNELRHCNIRSDLKHCLWRAMREVYLKPAVRKVWEETFGHPVSAQRANAPRRGRIRVSP